MPKATTWPNAQGQDLTRCQRAGSDEIQKQAGKKPKARNWPNAKKQYLTRSRRAGQMPKARIWPGAEGQDLANAKGQNLAICQRAGSGQMPKGRVCYDSAAVQDSATLRLA